jgi:hypothetical protein
MTTGLGNDDISEMGFYCKKLKSKIPLHALHTLYSSNPKNATASLRDLYKKKFPRGLSYEEHLTNPNCANCVRLNTKRVLRFCSGHPRQKAICFKFIPKT